MSLESARDDLVAASYELTGLCNDPVTSDGVYAVLQEAIIHIEAAVAEVDSAKEIV